MPRTPAKVRAKRDRMREYFQTLREPPERDSNKSSGGGSQLRYSPSGRHVHISTVNLLYENSNFAVFRKNQHSVSSPSTSKQFFLSSSTKSSDGWTSSHYEESQDKRRNRYFAEFLYSLWKDKRMCDIIIKVNGQEIPAHKVALAAYSDKFTTRYCEQAPTTISEILLPNASVEAVQVLLDYIYTSDLNINPHNLESVMTCARQLGVTSANQICQNYIANFDKSNVLDLFPLAERQGLVDITAKMHAFVCDHFFEIGQSSSFLHTYVEHVRWIISKDELCVNSELDIFLAVLSWIEHDRAGRMQYAVELMQCIRFIHICPHDLVAHVEPVHHIFEITECKEMLYQAYRYHALKYSQSPLLSSCNTVSPRRYISPNSDVESDGIYLTVPKTHRKDDGRARYVPQGMDSQGEPSSLSPHTSPVIPSEHSQGEPSSLSPHTSPVIPSEHQRTTENVSHSSDDTKLLSYQPTFVTKEKSVTTSMVNAPNICLEDPPPLPVPPKPATLLALGGIDPFSDGSAVFCHTLEEYNPGNNSWRVISTIPMARHHLGAVMLDGYLFVIGGSLVLPEDPDNLCNPTDICFRFNPMTLSWSRIASLRTPRMYHATAVLEGVLYAICGQRCFGKALNSVEYYNPDTDTWQMITPAAEEKLGVAAVGHNRKLLVVGGFTETPTEKIVLDCVECYDPMTNSWTKMNSLPTPCCHSNLVEACGDLYLIGGSTVDSIGTSVISLSEVLRYHELNDVWETVTRMRIERHDAGATVIGSKIYIVGGICSSIGGTLSDMECYDVESEDWLSRLDPLTHPAMGVSCCTLPNDSYFNSKEMK